MTSFFADMGIKSVLFDLGPAHFLFEILSFEIVKS